MKCPHAQPVRMPVRFALTMRDRLKGLLRTHPDGRALLLAPCHSIHTFGMRHAIDVAFIDKQGVVVQIALRLKPLKQLRCPRAIATLERFSSAMPWFSVGDHIGITLCRREENCDDENMPSM